jgi:hypothetical protein
MTKMSLPIIATTLNVNGLNSPIKSPPEWIFENMIQLVTTYKRLDLDPKHI